MRITSPMLRYLIERAGEVLDERHMLKFAEQRSSQLDSIATCNGLHRREDRQEVSGLASSMHSVDSEMLGFAFWYSYNRHESFV